MQRLGRSPQNSAVADPVRVVAIGASAGGLFAISEVLRRLPKELCSSVVVVQHLSAAHKSSLVALLARTTTMEVREAANKAALEPGVVYIAPPGVHLVSSNKKLKLESSALVNFHRPSVDSMFKSMARDFGKQLVGVVLSGAGDDGAVGIIAIKKAGGSTIAQDPEEAEYSSMPRSAIATKCVDQTLPLAEIGPAIAELCIRRR